MEDLPAYLGKVRDALNIAFPQQKQDKYLDLAATEEALLPELLLTREIPAPDLSYFQEIVTAEIFKCNLDKVKIGINELLKHFLLNINGDNEKILAEDYLYRLRLLFKRCLLPDFPFPEEIWNYICESLRTTGTYVVEKGYFLAARELIESLSQMGRIAASKGMPTASTQSSLRIVENMALEMNQSKLASFAKNARFNLET